MDKRNNLTRKKLEEGLEPSVCRMDKDLCEEGQDVIVVTLPWLDDANDCIEVYIVRKENGEIEFSFD